MSDERPVAMVERVGRFLWSAYVVHGFMVYKADMGGDLTVGRRRAERKARRLLARYKRENGYRSERHEVAP